MKPNITVLIPACELRMDSRTVDVLARKIEVAIRKKTGKQKLHVMLTDGMGIKG